ncbi:MAG: tetratricopeptide repeat protein [Nitrospinaceae bacterium]|nr:tetratricopeptide repeat protein [Nitrospinaceae bacterium]
MTQRSGFILGGILFFVFLLLTPLGIFNDWIPPESHKGYYAVTTIDGGDDTGYYAFLRSVFFDGDLDFFNELHYAHSEKIMPTGYVFNNWQMGQALLFLPFFIVGHLLALLYQGLGYPVSVGGYSAPYYISTAVASVTFLFAGLMLVFKTLYSFIDKRFAIFVTLSIWLASPLIYFSFIRQRMSHTVEFFFAAVLIFAWIHFRPLAREADSNDSVSRDKSSGAERSQGESPAEVLRPLAREATSDDTVGRDAPPGAGDGQLVFRYAALGALLGFISMTRVINIAFFALIVVDLLWIFRAGLKSSATIKKLFMLGGAILGGFFLVMLPQIVCWYQLNGVPFPPRHMKYAGEGLSGISLLPLLEKVWDLFFSAKWGLMFSMPLAVAGGVGLFLKNKWLQEIRPGLLAYLAGIFAIVIIYPEDSASYGHRHLISALPVFALGLGNSLWRISETGSKWGVRVAVIGGLSAVLAQYCMLIQYKVALPYNHPEFTLKALGSTAELISSRADLLLRSTNFFNILSLPHPQSWDYLDGLFLLVFPLFQLAGLVGVLVLMKWMGKASWFQTKILDPRFILGKSAVVSIMLLVIVMIATPAKTQSEINARMKYQEAVKKGEAHLRSREIDEARVEYTLAAEMMPQSWQAYFMLGQTWQAQGRLDEANSFYRKVLVYNPYDSPTLVLLGNNLRREGKVEDAEKMLRSAIRAWPLNVTAYDSLAQLLAYLGKREEAIQWFNYALQVNPNYGPGHINLAMTYHSLNQEKMSQYHLSRALALGMKGPAVDQIKSIIFKTPGKP